MPISVGVTPDESTSTKPCPSYTPLICALRFAANSIPEQHAGLASSEQRSAAVTHLLLSFYQSASNFDCTSHSAPWCTQSTPVSVRRILPTWCVPSLSTRWGPFCDPPTPLNTLSRVVALRSASVRYYTPVISHCIIDSKRFRKHIKTHYSNRIFVDTL